MDIYLIFKILFNNLNKSMLNMIFKKKCITRKAANRKTTILISQKLIPSKKLRRGFKRI